MHRIVSYCSSGQGTAQTRVLGLAGEAKRETASHVGHMPTARSIRGSSTHGSPVRQLQSGTRVRILYLYVASRSIEGITPRITLPNPSSLTMATRVAVRPGGQARSAVAVQLPLAAAAAAASSLYTCILHGSGSEHTQSDAEPNWAAGGLLPHQCRCALTQQGWPPNPLCSCLILTKSTGLVMTAERTQERPP